MSKVLLPIASQKQVRSLLWKMALNHRSRLQKITLWYCFSSAVAASIPWLVGHIIQSLHNKNTHNVLSLVLGIFAAVVVQAIALKYASAETVRLGEDISHDLRVDFMSKVTDLPLPVVEKAGSGDLLTRTNQDVSEVTEVFRKSIPQVIAALFQIIFIVVSIILISPALSLVLIVLPIILIPAVWIYLKYSVPAYMKELESWSIMGGEITETIDGLATVESMNFGDVRRKAMWSGINKMLNAELVTLGMRLKFYPFIKFSFSITTLFALVWGSFLLVNGQATMAAVTAVVLYTLQLTLPIDVLIGELDWLQIGLNCVARLFGVQDIPAEIRSDKRKPHDGTISAHDVSYSYEAGHDILHELNLEIKEGEQVMIVGASGAGKSTFAKLLAGVDAPTAGSITIGGVEISKMPMKSLHQNIALITQEHHVFVGTLASNVALAQPEASTEQIKAALAKVGALEWAESLEDGLETKVGSGALTLTAAQGQLVAMARLILANPKTVILDEATSLVDPESAQLVEKSLAAVMQGRTVIAIAHHLHQAEAMDRIIVMEQGRIVENASHHELLANKGSYAKLWEAWVA